LIRQRISSQMKQVSAYKDNGGGVWPWVALISLCVAVFCLACAVSRSEAMSTCAGPQISSADRLAGGVRAAIGGRFFETADIYFHKGVPHASKDALRNCVFERLAEAVSPSEHVHAGGQEIAEIMPWLRLAAYCNPHDVETYLVASFWLAGEAGRPDLALDVLREAEENNPKEYRIWLERGRILLRDRRLAEAARAFDVGLAFWPGSQEPDGEDARHGLRNLLLHRAILLELSGDTAQAVRDLRRIVELYPSSESIRLRADTLENGRAPAAPAGEILTTLLRENAGERSACHREDEHGHDHGRDHDPSRDENHQEHQVAREAKNVP